MCMVIFEWPDSEVTWQRRMAKRDEVLNVCRRYANLFEQHQRVSITVETQGTHMTDEDIKYLVDHSDTQCPF